MGEGDVEHHLCPLASHKGLSSSWRGTVKNNSDGTNGDKYVTIKWNFWSCVGVSGGGMLCTTQILAGSGCALSLSNTHPKKIMDGF